MPSMATVIPVSQTPVYPISGGAPTVPEPQEGKEDRDQAASVVDPDSAVTLWVASWDSQLKQRARGIAWSQSAKQQKLLAVAAGVRPVDVEMVEDISWLAAIVHFFGVLGGERGLACPCGGALRWFLRAMPFLFFVFGFAFIITMTVPLKASAYFSFCGFLILPVAAGVGVGIVREPANRCVLELVELRARSDLELSAKESNVGPRSLTHYTKAIALFSVLILLGWCASFIAVPVLSGDYAVLVVGILGVPVIAAFLFTMISFQRWVACIGGKFVMFLFN